MGFIAAFAIGTASSIISQGFQYGWENVKLLQAGVDGLFAVASTALAYTGIGIALSAFAGMGLGIAQYTIDSSVFRDDFTWYGLYASAGFLGGLASGRGAQHLQSIIENLDDTGKIGIKAISSAINKYGYGIGYQRTLNLWEGRVLTSISSSISQNFTKSALIIYSTTISTYLLSYCINKIDWRFR